MACFVVGCALEFKFLAALVLDPYRVRRCGAPFAEVVTLDRTSGFKGRSARVRLWRSDRALPGLMTLRVSRMSCARAALS